MPARANASSPIDCRCCAAARRRVLADAPSAAVPEAPQLDTWLSAWKIEGRPSTPRTPASCSRPMPTCSRPRGSRLRRSRRARRATSSRPMRGSALRWQSRFSHVCVDEFQDVDAAQLRLVRLLAAPEDNLFVVGDDDQTIYAWRLADVRRILRFSDRLPGRPPRDARDELPVPRVRRRRLGAHGRRQPRALHQADPRSRAGSTSTGRRSRRWSTADPSWADAVARLAARGGPPSRGLCFLSRTRGELTPILLALVRAGVRHTTAISAASSSRSRVVALIDAARAASRPRASRSTSCAGSGSVAAGHATPRIGISSATRITPRSMPCSAGRPASHDSTPSSPPTTRRGRGSRPFAIRSRHGRAGDRPRLEGTGVGDRGAHRLRSRPDPEPPLADRCRRPGAGRSRRSDASPMSRSPARLGSSSWRSTRRAHLRSWRRWATRHGRRPEGQAPAATASRLRPRGNDCLAIADRRSCRDACRRYWPVHRLRRPVATPAPASRRRRARRPCRRPPGRGRSPSRRS